MNPLSVPSFDHPPPKRVRALTEAGDEDAAPDPSTYAFLRAAEAARLEVRREKSGPRFSLSTSPRPFFSSFRSPSSLFPRTRPPPRACRTRRPLLPLQMLQ